MVRNLAKSSKTSSKPQFAASEFINFPLSAEQKREIKAWHPDIEEIDNLLLRLEESGYRISHRYDDRNECHACWLNPVGDNHPNAGLTLSGRGSTPIKALKQALYIHSLFDGDWAGNYKQFKEEDLDD